ncbi:hypothetical protein EHI8A_130090 [Entamoeba histolytica HM-1:IMSS-B]|uniref:Uncharacterized protein n=6 Tax=Entamoeba histolytica TaxID=5759 RepID=C4LWB2_ENTH1|nr:hypothetical protein EHI_155610 [Entamoeba histolytica HM-1:IMSS]EMD49319.1 Hypothetical protein EHI5A_091020 [Entamoeba histolytica KU27]EMH72764.1 hypothetical protein EHI8A_130090 [Entamoeba histolytica HM-1:IMSS-B]EMS16560.1 hypothetical protein KM1_108340 [Entamoeba histolytica HM-3:IMSS]ENY61781.1 hypothetical protein EHI7A_056450 [Entamoeba histolytica HM-1:IMSS-A]GAT92991.1 hypothetical protein CL6EHI_155610 [Entamoeba histolytica]|eukprot:XP_655781.1 hypothetical protein EHI_155610 [Entamoeba histolytica HM-1:IMSS]
MNIAWEEHEARLNEGDMKHRSVLNVILWSFGQIPVEMPNEFTHRINIIFLLLLIEEGVNYTTALAIFSAVILVCSILGGIINFVILCFAVRYAWKKQTIIVIAAFFLIFNIAACWIYHYSAFAILLFFTAWLPQAAIAMHGSQIPFISTTDLHQFADHLSILMSMITGNLYIYIARILPNLQYFNSNTQALAKLGSSEVVKPTGTIYITTGICVFGILCLIPYLFLQEHSTKPPIKSFRYNFLYIFNEFITIIGDMLHEKNFLLLLVCIVGIQYGPLYVSILFSTVQSDIFHTSELNLEIKENIFFYMYFICFFIVPPILHKWGPRFMMLIMLAATIIETTLQMVVVFSEPLSYVACVCCGFVNASMNVTIRRFIYENCTYETISMHYGVVTILIKIMNSVSVLLSLIYSFQENTYYFIRYFLVICIFFILACIGIICAVFTKDHHKEYVLGLRPPYLRYKIIEEKD